MTDNYDNEQRPEYPIFKGLQKPLEFMGLQGRYVTWACIAIGGALLGFIIVYCILGFICGLIVALSFLVTGAAFIFVKQKKGLHTKKEDKGIFIYAYGKKL